MAFGISAVNYNIARRPYPIAVIEKIKHDLVVKNPYILDLGCGTGISTRQLASITSKIIGCDIDDEMIECAKDNSNEAISYQVGKVDNLLFRNDMFDAITAFGSFHWFADDKSVLNIKRMLASNGKFIIVNKNDVSEFRQEVIEFVSRYTNLQYHQQKKQYQPEIILQKNGFQVSSADFPHDESFHLEELISLIKSMKFWSFIETEKQDNIAIALIEHFSEKLKTGFYKRKLNIHYVFGVMN